MSEREKGRKSDQTVELDEDRSIETIAQDIAIHRSVAVAESLCHMAAIRSLQTDNRAATALIQCRAAKVQDRTATEGHQAAHFLPGQIAVDGVNVWNLAKTSRETEALRSKIQRLQIETMAVFARTAVLPAIFNRADSQAERISQDSGVQGLKEVFRECVSKLWTNSRVNKQCPLAIDTDAILLALGHWFEKVNAVYLAASERKLDKSRSAKKDETAEKRLSESRVLAEYCRSFDVKNPRRFLYAHAGIVYEKYSHLR